MAYADLPRDHGVDANPDVSRKRARLSESPTSSETLPIEAFAPENIGTDLSNAIEIQDDDSMTMAPYDESVHCWPDAQTARQLDQFRKQLASGYYMQVRDFIDLSGWLSDHTEAVTRESRGVLLERFSGSEPFFNDLAYAVKDFLQQTDIFDPAEAAMSPGFTTSLETFVQNIVELCVRHIRLLPDITKEKLARRDSAQQLPSKSDQHHIFGLAYIHLLDYVFRMSALDTKYLRVDLGVGWKATLEACSEIVWEHPDTFKALVSVLSYLGQSAREIKDAWYYIDAILRIMRRSSAVVGEAAEEMVHVVNIAVMPTICEKHPRALPDDFHNTVVTVCGGAIEMQAMERKGSPSQCQAMYERLAKADDDALLVEDPDSPQALEVICQGDGDIRAMLLRATWTLQAERRFIVSSIMDIRSCGITMLVNDLGHWFPKYCQSGTADHPVIQYAVRFLKNTALTSYIFSADSHASLISHCADIVVFLAATSNYTSTETDIIWQACTTSVEADFANASFAVLQRVCSHLDCEQLLYVTQKYAATPVSALSNYAALELLPLLFKCFHEKLPQSDTVAIDGLRVAASRTALMLIQHLHEAERTPAVITMYHAAMTEIAIGVGYPFALRMQLFECCIPAIIDMSRLASVSVAVLAIFLRARMAETEAQQLLAKLPVSAVVDELRNYVKTASDHKARQDATRDTELRTRIGVVVRLLSFVPRSQVEVLQDELYQLLLGDGTMNNVARHIAWHELSSLANSQNHAPVATQLLERYLDAFVPSLPTDYATPALIAILTDSLKARLHTGMSEDHVLQPLELPLWKTLVRIAAESLEAITANAAVEAVCDLLFVWPQYLAFKDSIAVCYVQFIRDFVGWVCTKFSHFDQADVGYQAAKFRQAIELLSTVLRKSKEMQSSAQLVVPMARITLDGSDDDPKALCFSLQLCSPQGAPTITSVQASETSSVADLAAALPGMTGADSNRVIIGGKLVNLQVDAAKKLSEVGVESSGVIMICPIYTPHSDLETVLTVSGPVEQEMLAQYDRLEPFLNGPPAVARIAFEFLTKMRPSASARLRVCAVDATAADLFPIDSACRTAYSAHVLKTQLTDYARLGVADQRFIVQGVHLLTACALDERRLLDTEVLLPIGACLGDFLRERPPSASTTPYFDDPLLFARRMLDLLHQAVQLGKGSLIMALYQVTLQAARVDTSVWQAFSQDERFNTLHGIMFLIDDVKVSGAVIMAANSFCGEANAPDDTTDKYWLAVMAAIPQALQKNFGTKDFFGIATGLLARNSTLQSSEADIRQLIAALLGHLRTHEHTESPEYSMADEATVGLLRLLAATVTILKSFKRPLALTGTASELFERLLFPPIGSPPRPLLHEASRGLAFDLVKSICEDPGDYKALIQLADVALQSLPPNPNDRFPGYGDWIRPADACAGLSNLGMTCYMNSLLQQLFANVAFRKFIFDAPIIDSGKQLLLQHVQDLFAQMQDSPMPCINTSQLAGTLGIQTDSQEDVHGFYATLLTRLEECMPDAERKRAMSRFFTGKFISQVRGECGHISAQAEAFTDVSITVKNKASLQESLDEFVQGEPMQGANKYRCQSCNAQDGGRLVNAMKRTCLDETPDNLTFCLKRFTFEAMMGLEGKANDRFDFSAEIDLARYQRQHLENPQADIQPDVFDLVGVIVHQGSLEFGHYWSYVRLGNSAEPAIWVQLEDKAARSCQGVQEVQAQCCGGLYFANGMERSDNAYVLFYQRRNHAHADASLVKGLRAPSTVASRLPPRVEAPSALTESNVSACHWRWRIAHLFGLQFSAFIDWLMASCPGPDTKINSSAAVNADASGLVECLAAVSARYLLHLLLTDPAAAKKTQSFLQAIAVTELGPLDRALFDTHFIQEVTQDSEFLAVVWRVPDACYRAGISKMLESRLMNLKESEDQQYGDILRRVVRSHSVQLKDLGAIYDRWKEYFDFITSIVRIGAAETKVVLDEGYLQCIWDVVYIEYMDTETKKKYAPIFNMTKKNNIDLTPLFGFLCGVLDDHVSLEETGVADDGPCTLIGDMLLLRQHDLNMFLYVHPIEQVHIWLLAHVACNRCPMNTVNDLLEYPPGKLFGILTERGPIDFLRALEKTLLARCRDEQYKLLPLLSMALNYLSVKPEDSHGVLKQISREMPPWAHGFGLEIIMFYSMAANIVRGAAIDSSPDWAPRLLHNKNAQVRRGTIEYLAEHVFAETQYNAQESAVRIRASRFLAAACLPFLRKAYHEGQRYVCLPDMLATMKMEEMWLTAFHDELRYILSDEQRKKDAALGPELLVEYDESKSTLAQLQNTLKELNGWDISAAATTTPVLTTRAAEVTASSEAEDDDLLSSEVSDVDAEGDIDE